MKLKTLGDLKSKSWYRLLQVVYIIAFIVSIIGTIAWSIDESITESKRNYPELAKVICDNGKQYLLNDAKKIVTISGDNYNNIYDIKAICARGIESDLYDYPITTHEKSKPATLYPILRDPTTPTEYVTGPWKTKNDDIDKMPQNYKVEWVYHDWSLMLLWGLLIMIGIVAGFWFVGVCFHYILTGKIFPSKGHSKEPDTGLVCASCNNTISENDVFCEKCGKKTK